MRTTHEWGQGSPSAPFQRAYLPRCLLRPEPALTEGWWLDEVSLPSRVGLCSELGVLHCSDSFASNYDAKHSWHSIPVYSLRVSVCWGVPLSPAASGAPGPGQKVFHGALTPCLGGSAVLLGKDMQG